jgi:hypothetical protein
MLDFAANASGVERIILKAYIAGYLGHYSLDSCAHPLIYAQQYAFCRAGVADLDESDGSVVHGQIEADLDAMMLYRNRSQTIRSFKPANQILQIDDRSLATIDALYCHLAADAFNLRLPKNAFSRSLGDMRLTLRLLYSPHGIKRNALGRLERLVRRHSLVQAMSTPVPTNAVCDFDNRESLPWQNPFTGEMSNCSFVQLYDFALELAAQRIDLLANLPADLLADGGNVGCLAVDKSFDGKPL